MSAVLADLKRLVDEQQHQAEEIRSDMLEMMLDMADLLEKSVTHEYVDVEHALALVQAARRIAGAK